jgi:hypothetical protein
MPVCDTGKASVHYAHAKPYKRKRNMGTGIFNHIAQLDAEDFVDLEDASTATLLSAQASTAEFMASLGSCDDVIEADQLHLARSAFAAVTNPAQTEAEKQKAILALKVPPAVRHLAGMLSEYDWEYIEQAKELRGYVVAKLLEETKHADAKIRLKALELTGKLTGIDSFTTRVEVTHKESSADEIEARIRAKLASMLPPVQEIETLEVKAAT